MATDAREPATESGETPDIEEEGTITAEDLNDTALTQPDELSELRSQLEQAESKAEENWDQFVRAKAEIENVRRRAERDVQNAHKFAVEKLVGELLPVRDSLEMGIAAARDEGASLDKLLEGSDLTLKMLSGVLNKFGVEVLDPVGERFNPELHEAIAMQPGGGAEPNSVLQVIQKGYRLHDRVVRPAMVIVAQGG
jgi:molecular chaperone GrpE